MVLAYRENGRAVKYSDPISSNKDAFCASKWWALFIESVPALIYYNHVNGKIRMYKKGKIKMYSFN